MPPLFITTNHTNRTREEANNSFFESNLRPSYTALDGFFYRPVFGTCRQIICDQSRCIIARS